ERVGGGRADADGAAAAGDAAAHRIGGGEGLVAGGLEGGRKGTAAAAERAVGRQRCLTVGAAEVERAAVAGGGVVEGIVGRDGKEEAAARRGAAGGNDAEVGGTGGADGDAAGGAGDGTGISVGGGDGLATGGDQGDAIAEGVHAVV